MKIPQLLVHIEMVIVLLLDMLFTLAAVVYLHRHKVSHNSKLIVFYSVRIC